MKKKKNNNHPVQVISISIDTVPSKLLKKLTKRMEKKNDKKK